MSLAPCYAIKNIYPIFGDSIKGGFAKCFVYECYYKNGDFHKTDPRLSLFDKADDRGNETDWVSYSSDGLISGKRSFIYDIDDNIIEYCRNSSYMFDEMRNILYSLDEAGFFTEFSELHLNGSLFTREKSKYNSMGKILESSREDFQNSYQNRYKRFKDVNRYDSNGNLFEHLFLNLDSSLSGTNICKYNNFGKLTELYEYFLSDKKCTISERQSLKYNEFGKIIEMSKYKSHYKNTFLLNITTYQYVNNLKIVDNVEYNGDCIIRGKSNEIFDEKDNKIESTYIFYNTFKPDYTAFAKSKGYYEGNIYVVNEFCDAEFDYVNKSEKYNEKKQIIERIEFNINNLILKKINYDYDQYGNLSKEVEYHYVYEEVEYNYVYEDKYYYQYHTSPNISVKFYVYSN